MARRSLRRVVLRCLLLLLGLGVLLVGRPTLHVLRTVLGDEDQREAVPEGMFDDASRLNLSQVREVFAIPDDADEAEAQLSKLLARASDEGLRVSIAGARHSMGGHTIAPDGIVIDMRPFDGKELDAERSILTVQAGALWADIIPFLDARSFSVGVLQSDNSFSVGGSISVNCHGWVYDRPPISSTVESLRLMQADGRVLRCSRDENAELFSLVLGGYGLFGVILDVELRVVPNECYRLSPFVVPIDEAWTIIQGEVIDGEDVRMFYGRVNVVPDEMFSEVVINVLTLVPDGEIPTLGSKGLETLRRAIFRGSVDSDYGKQLRWDAESRLHPFLSDGQYSRNQLINEGVELFGNRSAATTDILHEYFVPEDKLTHFLELARGIITGDEGNLLNVTLRSVNEDTDTFLRYADQRMLAFVMLFNQERTDEGEERMQRMTQGLIDAAHSLDGSYYLPYRLHATAEQFHAAYPMAREFFGKKREYDPGELFQNQFYLRYGESQLESGK